MTPIVTLWQRCGSHSGIYCAKLVSSLNSNLLQLAALALLSGAKDAVWPLGHQHGDSHGKLVAGPFRSCTRTVGVS